MPLTFLNETQKKVSSILPKLQLKLKLLFHTGQHKLTEKEKVLSYYT